ncbi:MAG: transposase [Chitinivibrionales bacterium]|nr:transposase [Chitinivibrionales bacterium]
MIWFTRGTMVGWIKELCELLQPVYRAMIAEMKSNYWIFSDDSLVRRITKDQGSHTSYMWVYLGCDGRVVIFDYRDSKSAQGPRHFLNNFCNSISSPHTYYFVLGFNASPQLFESGHISKN